MKAFFSKGYDVIDIDGVRVNFADGWGLVRASNTQPALVLRFEATSEASLQKIQAQMVNKLEELGCTVNLPE
jgi:phosphomannomutase/phosphoglucomutase